MMFHLPLHAAHIVLQLPARMLEGVADGEGQISLPVVGVRRAAGNHLVAVRQRQVDIDLVIADAVMAARRLQHDARGGDAAEALLELIDVPGNDAADARIGVHALKIDLDRRLHDVTRCEEVIHLSPPNARCIDLPQARLPAASVLAAEAGAEIAPELEADVGIGVVAEIGVAEVERPGGKHIGAPGAGPDLSGHRRMYDLLVLARLGIARRDRHDGGHQSQTEQLRRTRRHGKPPWHSLPSFALAERHGDTMPTPWPRRSTYGVGISAPGACFTHRPQRGSVIGGPRLMFRRRQSASLKSSSLLSPTARMPAMAQRSSTSLTSPVTPMAPMISPSSARISCPPASRNSGLSAISRNVSMNSGFSRAFCSTRREERFMASAAKALPRAISKRISEAPSSLRKAFTRPPASSTQAASACDFIASACLKVLRMMASA